jgi:hypothetical protein
VSSHRAASEVSSCKFLTTNVHRKLVLGLTLGFLGFGLGCGSGGPSIPITGSFSNNSLKGNYTFHLYGLDVTGNQYAESGTFVADGNGNITSGTDDFNQAPNGFSSNAITGTYGPIGKDGNGQITFTLTGIAPPNTFQVAVTLVSASQLYMTEVDSFANAAGEANLQDTTAFAAPPNGTFAFLIHDAGATNSASMVGSLTSTAGAVSGTLDELRSSTLHSGVTFTAGSFSSPDNSGRGTLNFTDSLGIPSSYIYYVIDANTVEVLQTDANNLGLGRFEKQSGGPYSLSGNYVFGSKGDTLAGGLNILLVRSVGGFTADGMSAIPSGAYDSAENGGLIVNQPFTGSFTATSNGRVAVTLNPQGSSPIAEVFWMVNSGRAFFLVNDSTKVEDGTIDAQQAISFTNASLTGQYAYGNDGNDLTPEWLTRVGTFIPDGNGKVHLNEVVNVFTPANGAILNSPLVPGTYVVSASGRGTSTLTGSTNNVDLVFYMASPSAAYVLQSDSGVQVGGKMAIQVSP